MGMPPEVWGGLDGRSRFARDQSSAPVRTILPPAWPFSPSGGRNGVFEWERPGDMDQ